MVIGLLILTAIPTVTAIAEGIAEQGNQTGAKRDEQLMRKFNLYCWCEGKSKGKSDIHNGAIVLGEGKLWIQSPRHKPTKPLYPFEGFFIEYPDEQRPKPAPMGLVTRVSDDPPMMNWIYVDKVTSEVKHGNRTQSIEHRVGDWGFTNDNESDYDEDEENAEPGGLEFNSEENFVAVEPANDEIEGRWEVCWDQEDNKLKNVPEVAGRLVLRISLERRYVETEE